MALKYIKVGTMWVLATLLFSQVSDTQRINTIKEINKLVAISKEYPILAAESKFNMAQLYYSIDSIESASIYYKEAERRIHDLEIRSMANNQLGILAHKERESNETQLSYFKLALKQNPNNDTARYNYEIIKRRIKKNPPPPLPPPPVDMDNIPIPPTSNKPREKKALEYSIPSLTIEKARDEFAEYAKKEKQFLQQLKKSSSQEHKMVTERYW